ncbi:hypothetical protein [Sphingomonas sp.]|uniref:hypothetical protein n=1 Tax=Sphingomonas sp. TaxID=28214 RepID=UPI003B3BDFEA
MTRILFGEYRPDQPVHLSESLEIADGVVPIANGYAPISSFVPAGNGTLQTRCIGAAGYRNAAASYLFAATTTNIYSYSTSGYVSVAAGMTSTRSVGVQFCPYGPFMLATNGTDPIKKFDPASPGAMTNLGGSPPTARYLGVVRGFVVAGYAGGNPLRIAWSDNGNPANWTAGGASEAGLYDMPSGGDITGVVGGEYGLIFQERRILRMSYTADDTIWQFDEIVTDAGCIAPKSLASWGKVSFFWSDRGFMMCDGVSVQAIGDEKIDRTFQSLAERAYFETMSAVVDPRRALYIVALPSADPTSTVFLYNYAQGRWTTAALSNELMFSALSLSSSLEDLDAVYGSLDATTLSLDSFALRGGAPTLLLFDGAHRLGQLSGPNIAATLVDARRDFAGGARARIRTIRPLTDAATATVAISGSNSLAATPQETSYDVATANGFYRCRENWSLAQVKLAIPAGAQWTYAQGYDVEAVPGGRP